QLRDSESDLDELTVARLHAARRRALELVGRRRRNRYLGWGTGGIAMAAMMVLTVVLWTNGRTPAPVMFGDDWDMLAEVELQLIEDLEFYDWLPEEDTAG
ncbi:MAG: hypothetical protein R3308_08095, partial [Thiohalobacterales bacterium]|nr:hypothetical protein [Thiohalobacterales bacterium]